MPLHLKLRLLFSFRLKLILAFLAVIVIAVIISFVNDTEEKPQKVSDGLILSTTQSSSAAETTEEITTEQKQNYDTYIILADDKTIINGEGATFSQGRVHISESGVYAIKGSLENGCIDISNDAYAKLILMGVSVNCETGSALRGRDITEKTEIYSAEETLNVFSGGTNSEAVICSDGQLVFSGQGTLVVKSDRGVAVEAEDEVYIKDVTVQVVSKNDGIVGESGFGIRNADISVVSAGDGIKTVNDHGPVAGDFYITESRLDIYSGYDGISAAGSLDINGGKLEISTSGNVSSDYFRPSAESGFSADKDDSMVFISQNSSNSPKDAYGSAAGLKAEGNIEIAEAGLKIKAKDNAVYAGNVTIESGYISLSAEKNGIVAAEQVKINGGAIDITDCDDGLESEMISLNGGTLIIKAKGDGITASSETEESGCLVELDGAYVQIDSESDGIDSDGDIVILDGTLVVFGSQKSDESAFDFDGRFSVISGTVLALSQKHGEQKIQTDGLPVLSYTFADKVSGTGAILKENGNSVIGYHTPKTYDYVMLISGEVAENENCEVYVGGSFEQNSVDGIYFGKYNKGTFAGRMK